jgi:peptidoglycan-N-acetylglucosamine deacetylase
VRVFLSLILVAFAFIFTPASAQQKRIALSFDDVPRGRGAFLSPDERTERLIAALKNAGVEQAVFFLNPAKLADADSAGGEARIAAYVAAGHVIGNHSNTHPHLNTMSADDYLVDIDAAEQWLKGRNGYRPWFRFPFLDEGGADKVKRDAVRAGLTKRGLRNGYVTADGSDWNLEALTVKAAADGTPMNMTALRRLYVASQMSGVEYHNELARRTIGRSPAHVLLLHETDLAALYIGDLVAELRAHGWTIITADEAYADPLASVMPDVPFAAGTLTGSMAWQKDIEPPLWPFWITSTVTQSLFEKRVLAKAIEP